MARYGFDVIRLDEIVFHDEAELATMRDVWDRIARLAHRFPHAARLRVCDERGFIVVMIGAATLGSLSAATSAVDLAA